MSRRRLEEHRVKIRRILDMFPSSHNPIRASNERIRTAFKGLTAAVRTDLAQRESGPDARYSDEAMRRLLANLQRLNANTEPGPRWTLPLAGADVDVSQALVNWPKPAAHAATSVSRIE